MRAKEAIEKAAALVGYPTYIEASYEVAKAHGDFTDPKCRVFVSLNNEAAKGQQIVHTAYGKTFGACVDEIAAKIKNLRNPEAEDDQDDGQ